MSCGTNWSGGRHPRLRYSGGTMNIHPYDLRNCLAKAGQAELLVVDFAVWVGTKEREPRKVTTRSVAPLLLGWHAEVIFKG
jgi:hypothetical protein